MPDSKIVRNLSSDEYHKQLPWEDHYFSSSQWKRMLEDPEIFYRMYIGQSTEKEDSKPAFDIGTYYHTAILEPQDLLNQCAVWKGGKRQGKLWEAFQQMHKGKAIITLTEKISADRIIEATLNSKIAMGLVDDPEAEVELSIFTTFNGVKCKIRTDVIRLGKHYSYILDLKSTQGNVRDREKIRKTIEGSGYDLSAAYYIDIANQVIKELRLNVAPVTDFYWTFASKDKGICQTYKATKKQIEVGRAKYTAGMEIFNKHAEDNWENIFKEELLSVEPSSWEVHDWLNIDGEQFL